MDTITDLARKIFDDDASKRFLTTFNISTSNDPNQAIFSATKFFTVNAFVRPAIEYTKAWPDPSKVHLFAFNQGNPFPGLYQGCATHTIDALYQFQHLADQFPTQKDRDIGVEFALALVDFAHGRENVPAFGTEQKVKVW